MEWSFRWFEVVWTLTRCEAVQGGHEVDTRWRGGVVEVRSSFDLKL
jgi:hypothetical protein